MFRYRSSDGDGGWNEAKHTVYATEREAGRCEPERVNSEEASLPNFLW